MIFVRSGMDTSVFVNTPSQPWEPTWSMPADERAGVAEMQILGVHVGLGRDVPFPALDPTVDVRPLIASLRAAHERGVRVALVMVDCRGGLVDAGRAIYDAIHDFRRGGGYVVTYLHRNAISTAASFWLSSDYVVASPYAGLWLHGAAVYPATGTAPDEEALRARWERDTAYKRGIFMNETLLSAEQIDAWIGVREKPKRAGASIEESIAASSGAILNARDAHEFAFVDEIGGFGRAEVIAWSALRGVRTPSPRRARLSRRAPACPSPAPAAVSAEAALVEGTRMGLAAAVVSHEATTRGANVDNLWPNPMSEDAPPPGVTVLEDGTNPEYDYRVDAGGGAFSGAWVRQLAAGAVGPLELPLKVPCGPGDSFVLTAATKRTVGTGQHGVSIAFYDKDGAQVGTTTTAWKATGTWDQATCSASAPAGAVSARLSLVAAVSTTAQFDAIYARRQVSHAVLESVGYGAVRSADYSESGGNPTNGCKLDLTAGGVTKFADNRFQVGGYMFSTPWFRALRALDGTAVSEGGSGVTWYRGNIDPSTAGAGAPIIHDATYGDRLTIYSPGTAGRVTFSQPTTLAMFGLPLRIIIQPKANTDNLDSLRRIKIVAFTSLGEQMGNPLHIPITDRLYKAAGTPGSSDNQNVIEGWFWLAGSVISAIYGYSPYCFNGYLRVTLYNAYGPSAERDFGPNGNVTTTALPGGATIPNASAPASSEGGGGSTICPAPQTRIRLATGALVAAADLWDGAEVLGADDRDPSQALRGIVRRPALGWARHRYAVALEDGRVLRFSQGHRLAAPRGWVPVEALRAGDELLGEQPGAVQSVRDEGFGQVMSFVVEGSHTYVADGVLSHNTKVSVP